MTVFRGFTIVIASSLACSLLGTFTGYLLGMIVPDYYRTVFHLPPDVSIDVVQIGIWLGLTQGLGAGLFIGLIIVVSVAWYNSRINTQK